MVKNSITFRKSKGKLVPSLLHITSLKKHGAFWRSIEQGMVSVLPNRKKHLLHFKGPFTQHGSNYDKIVSHVNIDIHATYSEMKLSLLLHHVHPHSLSLKSEILRVMFYWFDLFCCWKRPLMPKLTTLSTLYALPKNRITIQLPYWTFLREQEGVKSRENKIKGRTFYIPGMMFLTRMFWLMGNDWSCFIAVRWTDQFMLWLLGTPSVLLRTCAVFPPLYSPRSSFVRRNRYIQSPLSNNGNSGCDLLINCLTGLRVVNHFINVSKLFLNIPSPDL